MQTLEKIDRKANVNAYLILKQKSQVLLLLRQNTGYYDGYYGLVSGHIEAGESAQEGLIREAKEEAGISIDPHHLRFVHCMHRQTNRLNIDLFFECEVYQEEIINAEPEKCAAIKFFSVDSLPSNMIDYIVDAIKYSANKEFYSEQGWDS